MSLGATQDDLNLGDEGDREFRIMAGKRGRRMREEAPLWRRSFAALRTGSVIAEIRRRTRFAATARSHSNCLRNSLSCCFRSATSFLSSSTSISRRFTRSSSAEASRTAGSGGSQASTSPASKCAQRDSFVPGRRGNWRAGGKRRAWCRAGRERQRGRRDARRLRPPRPGGADGVGWGALAQANRSPLSRSASRRASCWRT